MPLNAKMRPSRSQLYRTPTVLVRGNGLDVQTEQLSHTGRVDELSHSGAQRRRWRKPVGNPSVA
jgi:hypothetical protein